MAEPAPPRRSPSGCWSSPRSPRPTDGSLGTAHAYVDAVARTGADVVKFQTHIAAAESTSDEPWRTRLGPRKETRYEYWKRMEFTEAEWVGLRRPSAAVTSACASTGRSCRRRSGRCGSVTMRK